MDNPDEWGKRGEQAAQHELAEYKAPTGYEQRKAWTAEQFDAEHEAFYNNRSNCIAQFVLGYYEVWNAALEKRRQERLEQREVTE